MSTGDVRRPEVNKLSAKAVAADGNKPDKVDEKSAANEDASKSAAKAQDSKTPGSKTRRSRTPLQDARSEGSGSEDGRSKRRPGAVRRGRARAASRSRPVKVNQGINWGPSLMFGAAGLIAV